MSTNDLSPWTRPEDAGFSTARLRRLHDGMQRLVNDGSLPGITWLIARRGRIVDMGSHGVAVRSTGMAIGAETVCRWYSISKAVTGMAMMLLYEEGLWRFEDPVAAVLPEVGAMRVSGDGIGTGDQPLARPLLMHDLLGHRAGFAYGIQDDGPHEVDRLYARDGVFSFDRSGAEMLARAARLPLVAQPGTRFHYSISLDLCGIVIERLTGKPLGEFMRERLFEPLGMLDTGFMLNARGTGRLADLWRHGAGGVCEPASSGVFHFDATRPPAFESGGGGLLGTLLDCWRFAEFVAGRRNGGDHPLLAPSTRRMACSALHRDVPSGLGEQAGIGYTPGGMYLMDDPAQHGSPLGRGSISAAGAAGGWFSVDPEHGVVLVGLMNVLGWARGTPPSYLAEVLAYQALVER